MSLIAKKSGNFEPPPEGVWPAICVDVVDLGMVNGQFGEKHKARIVWEISEQMKDGRPYLASKMYTVSLHEKSALHKDLKSWRGKAFTKQELEGFDVEKVIGCPAQLVITQEEKDGIVYGNVTAILRAAKNNHLQASGKYIRVKDRPDAKKVNGSGAKMESPEDNPEYGEEESEEYMSGSDIPF